MSAHPPGLASLPDRGWTRSALFASPERLASGRPVSRRHRVLIFLAATLALLLLIAVTICPSLNPQRYPTAKEWRAEPAKESADKIPMSADRRTASVWHSVRMEEITDRPRPRWYHKMSPLWWCENEADPLPPNWYRPGKRTRIMTWYLRNPFHNFSYYVIGCADHTTVRSGMYPDHNFNPHGGWNLAVTSYKRVRLPFVSYRRHGLTFYLGWRETGNFGAKIQIQRNEPSQGESMGLQ